MPNPRSWTARSHRVGAWLLGASGLLALIGSFLPWAAEKRWGRPSLLWGMDWGGGVTAFLSALVTLGAAVILRDTGTRLQRVVAALAALAGVLVLGQLVGTMVELLASEVPNSRVVVDLGAVLVLVGGVGACALGTSLALTASGRHGAEDGAE
ncbi:hypothetical protein M3G03_03960 [Aestuariimicrobium sp. p3-SID1156]|uniref:hypothetical protein n=1 Tax=Aestuariimicrobium sp. p3-SID1156 TaxID=2916038 RepID=UPI00223B7665|nr:hypothetical protein [Aestuariimicrobium sp. p3-SID1156]MCT1458706.1 hypothetical protein [Aestuariimicrobium sp. p3-SID1156]